MNYSEMTDDYRHNMVGMQTTNAFVNENLPVTGKFPYAYFEWTFRNDNVRPAELGNSFWSWVTRSDRGGDPIVELDFTETGYWTPSDGGGNRWSAPGSGGMITTFFTAKDVGLPISDYHTWGAMFTGDSGGAYFSVCSYVDGARTGCTRQPFDATTEYLQR